MPIKVLLKVNPLIVFRQILIWRYLLSINVK